jgi:hypothetical protein
MSTPNNAAPAAPATSTAPQTNEAPIENLEAESAEGEESDESSDASAAPLENAIPKNDTKSAVKKALKQLKYKVDGKEFSEDLPFEIPDDPKAIEYMQRQIQLAKMGQGRAQQHTELQKEVASFLKKLQNPKTAKEALRDPNIGLDVKQLAREIIEEEIANSQKSPEQLEKEKLEAEIKSLKDQQKKEKEEAEKREFDRLQETAYEQYDMQITKALEGSDLPKSPYVIKKMAEYMLLGLQNNLDISAEDILPLVRDEIQNDIKDMFSALPDEVVEKMVGKDKLNSLRKKKVAKAKELPPTPLTKSLKDVAAPKKEIKPYRKGEDI